MIFKLSRLTTVFWVLLVGLSASSGFAIWHHNNQYENIIKLLQVKNYAASKIIEKYVADYVAAAEGIGGFFSASNNVTEKEWQQFIDKNNIIDRYTGILSIQFIEWIEAEQIKKRNLDVFPADYQGQYCVVTYESVSTHGYPMRGLNRCAKSNLRQILFESRDNNRAMFSSGIVQQLENDFTDTILVHPMYQNNVFIGWVAFSINLKDMFQSMFRIFDRELETDFEVFLLDSNNKNDQLIYDHDSQASQQETELDPEKYYTERHAFSTFGSTNNLNWKIVSNVTKSRDYQSWLIFILGCTITSLLGLIILSYATYRNRLQKTIDQLTIDYGNSQSKLRAVMDTAPVGIYQTNAAGECIYVSPKWQEITGLSQEQATGSGWISALHPDDKQIVIEKWVKAVSNKSEFIMDFRVARPDNRVIWVSSYAAPFFSDGQYQGYVGTNIDISDRKSSEKSILSARDKFQMLFNSAIDAVILIDANMQIRDCNKAAINMFNIYSKEDLINKTIFALFAKNNKCVSEFEQFVRNALHNKDTTREWNFCRTDLISVPCDISVKKIFMANEYQIIATFHDLTIHKKTEQELKKTTLQLDLAIEGANDGLWDWDLTSNHVYFSPRWKEQLGYQDHELENTFSTWESRVHPDDIQNVHQQIQNVLKNKSKYYVCEHRLKHRNGEWRWILARGSCAYDEIGIAIRMVGFHTDITETKNIIEQQKVDHQLLVDSIENIDAGFALFDKNQNLVMANSTYVRLYHLPKELAAPGTSYKDILCYKLENGLRIPSNIAPELWIQKRLEQHRKQSRLYEEYNFNNKIIRITDRRTVEDYIVSVHSDITAAKEQSIQLSAAKEAAENANNAKSDFLATMSHEIRTPMNGIIGITDIVLGTALNSEQKEYIKTIKNSAQTLLTIINDILDFSKLESGKLHFEYIDFSLKESLEKIYGLMKSSAESKGIKLNINIADDCPKHLFADPTRLQQVILNLVSNAIKFTDQGQVELDVKCTYKSENKAILLFNVIDTGIGIPPSSLPNLFERFSQSDKTISRKFGGTGLGLWICRQIIEKMGGKIGVDSELGKGSRFWFELQMDIGHENASKTDSLPELASTGMSRRLSILVAEDNKVNQMVITAILKKMGHKTDIANNGIEAIDLLQQHDYDIILMDIQMPEKDGIEATKEIRNWQNNKSGIPIIAITANAMKGDREIYLNAGMSDYISKPINVAELKIILENYTKLSIDSPKNKH